MYEFWFPPEQQVGKSLVLVSDDQRALEAPELGSFVERLEPVRKLSVGASDRVGTRYFARVAHGYRGIPSPGIAEVQPANAETARPDAAR
jgi:hypothetical protein